MYEKHHIKKEWREYNINMHADKDKFIITN